MGETAWWLYSCLHLPPVPSLCYHAWVKPDAAEMISIKDGQTLHHFLTRVYDTRMLHIISDGYITLDWHYSSHGGVQNGVSRLRPLNNRIILVWFICDQHHENLICPATCVSVSVHVYVSVSVPLSLCGRLSECMCFGVRCTSWYRLMT